MFRFAPTIKLAAMESDYEKLRQENIRRNEELMRELQVLGGGSAMGGPGSKPNHKPAHQRTTRKAPKRKAVSRSLAPLPKRTIATRSSARLRGVSAEQPAASPEIKEEARRDPRLPPEGDLDLPTLGGGELSRAKLAALRASLERASLVQGAEAATAVKGATLSADEEELSSILAKMELRAGDKVTAKRLYSMTFHPGDDNLIFMGDTDGTVGVWQPSAAPAREDGEGEAEEGALPTGASYSLPGGHGKACVTCLKFDPVSDQSLYSSSYDASIRVLSLADQISRPVWQSDGDILFSGFEILAPSTHAAAFTATPHPATDERQLWLADYKGGLLHLDLREQKVSGSTRRWQVAEKKIGALSVNPSNSAVIATASLDQHVRLFDVRNLSMLEEMNAPSKMNPDAVEAAHKAHEKTQLGHFKTRYAFTAVDFSPLGNHLVGISYDDWISLWHFDKPAALTSEEKAKWWEKKKIVKPEAANALSDPHRFAHNNQTGRWVTPLRALWNRNPNVPPHFTIGGMNHRAEIYSADGTLLRELYDPEHVTAVPAVTVMHPRIPGRLATGNGSGRCFFWS